jgi:hypothetical protein
VLKQKRDSRYYRWSQKGNRRKKKEDKAQEGCESAKKPRYSHIKAARRRRWQEKNGKEEAVGAY